MPLSPTHGPVVVPSHHSCTLQCADIDYDYGDKDALFHNNDSNGDTAAAAEDGTAGTPPHTTEENAEDDALHMPAKLRSIVRQEDNSDLEQWVAATLDLGAGTFALTDAAVLYTAARYAALRDMRAVQREMFGAFLSAAEAAGVPRSDLCSVDVYMARDANAAHRQAVCYALRALAERIHGSPNLLEPVPVKELSTTSSSPSTEDKNALDSAVSSSTATSASPSNSQEDGATETKQEEEKGEEDGNNDLQKEQEQQQEEQEQQEEEQQKPTQCEDLETILRWLREQDQEVLESSAVLIQKTWRMHAAQGVYRARQRDVRARRAVVQELVDTEEAYVDSLQTCVKIYAEPMLRWVRQGPGAAAGVTEADVRAIFGDLGVIIKLNAFFLERLLPLRHNFGPQTRVAAPVRGIVDFLPLYSEYVVHYAGAMAHYGRLLAENGAFAAFEHRCRASARNSRNYDMESFLVQPVQRVPHYILLLRALLRHTWPEHPDRAPLAQALERAQRVAAMLNSRRRDGENAREYARLRGVVTGLPRDTPFDAPQRRLVRYAHVRSEAGKPLLLLLFSDCLMAFADARRTRFLCRIPLADLSLLPLGATELQIARSRDQQAFDIVAFLSAPVRADFLEARQQLCDEIARERQHREAAAVAAAVAASATASASSTSASSASPASSPTEASPRKLTNEEYVDRVKNFQQLGADRDELSRAVERLRAEAASAGARNDAELQRELQGRLEDAQARLRDADAQRAHIQRELAAPGAPATPLARSAIVPTSRTSSPSSSTTTKSSSNISISTSTTSTTTTIGSPRTPTAAISSSVLLPTRRGAHTPSASTAPSPVGAPRRVPRRAGSTSDAVRLDALLQARPGRSPDPPSPVVGPRCLLPSTPGPLMPSRPAHAPAPAP